MTCGNAQSRSDFWLSHAGTHHIDFHTMSGVLGLQGYSVDVVEFVEAKHTPRNTLIRARKTGIRPTAELQREYESLISEWRVTPYLAKLLPGPVSA